MCCEYTCQDHLVVEQDELVRKIVHHLTRDLPAIVFGTGTGMVGVRGGRSACEIEPVLVQHDRLQQRLDALVRETLCE